MKVQVTLKDGVKILVDYIKSADHGYNAITLLKRIKKGVDFEDWRTLEFKYGATMRKENDPIFGDEWINICLHVKNVKCVEFIVE